MTHMIVRFTTVRPASVKKERFRESNQKLPHSKPARQQAYPACTYQTFVEGSIVRTPVAELRHSSSEVSLVDEFVSAENSPAGHHQVKQAVTRTLAYKI